MNNKDKLIEKQKEYNKYLLWRIDGTGHSAEKQDRFESEINSLEQQIEAEEKTVSDEGKNKKSDELKYEFGADNIFNEIDTNL